jgi:hypothetical protein
MACSLLVLLLDSFKDARTCQEDVVREIVLKIFRGGSCLLQSTKLFLMMIPKVKHPQVNYVPQFMLIPPSAM